MTDRNQKMRDALKEIEATVTTTLAQQPEDDEKCGQALHHALVKVRDMAVKAAYEELCARDNKKFVTDCKYYNHQSGKCSNPYWDRSPRFEKIAGRMVDVTWNGQCVHKKVAADIFNKRIIAPLACRKAAF